jgi:hypothetical protein
VNRLLRVLLVVAALCLAAAGGYFAGVRSAGRTAAPASEQPLDVRVAPAAPAPASIAPPPPAPPPPKPKAAAVVDQDLEAQVAEDAAAVGMTTLEPDPADEPASDEASSAASSVPPY